MSPISATSPIFFMVKNLSVALLYHDGTVKVVFSEVLQISCCMQSCLFPLDTHNCTITLILPDHNVSEAILEPGTGKKKFLKEQPPLWKVSVMEPVVLDTNPFSNPNNWKSSMVERTLTLQRKPQFVYVNIVLPMVLIFGITVAAIILPRESGEKISLLVTCFLAQIVYLDALMSIFPRTSDYVPILTVYASSLLAFTTVQIIISCVDAYFAREASANENTGSIARRIFGKKRAVICKRRDRVEHLNADNENAFTKETGQESTEDQTQVDDSHGRVHKSVENQENSDANNEEIKYIKTCRRVCNAMQRLALFISILEIAVVPFILQMMFFEIIPNFCTKRQ
eukprot:gene15876-17476_t